MKKSPNETRDRSPLYADPPPMFDFSRAELDQATDALEAFYQDHEMEREMMRMKDIVLFDQLKQRGISQALAKRMLRDLVVQKVYITGNEFVNIRIWCALDGSKQVDETLAQWRYLYTTRARLRAFFANHRAARESRKVAHDSLVPDPSLCVFRLSGEVWELTFKAKTVHMKHSVGLSYISRLVREPNKQVPAVALLAAQTGIDPGYLNGGPIEILDDSARIAYRKELSELREELATARDSNNEDEMRRIEGQLEHLGRELAQAIGLGGRNRKSDDVDRVRKSVSTAVTRALDKVQLHHEALWHHLTNAIALGRTFCYAPADPIEWIA